MSKVNRERVIKFLLKIKFNLDEAITAYFRKWGISLEIWRDWVWLYGKLNVLSLFLINILLKIIVSPGKRDCYYENFKADTSFELEYQVSS